jgi:FkbH-like protein
LADFNVQNLAVLLRKGAQHHAVQCVQGPFGQTTGVLLDGASDFWSAAPDALVVWTLPQRAVPAFARTLRLEGFSPEELLQEVDAFVELLQWIPSSVATVILPTWTAMFAERGWGPRDLANNLGVANALMRMNLRLADRLSSERRMIVLDAQRWMAAQEGAYSPRLWYTSKTPFQASVFQEAAKDILAALDGVSGHSRKLVILDLDDTLWGGVVGEGGWEKIRLGGHDPSGEAFVDVQRALKRLTNRGVVLAIVSKNEEAVALEAIDRHPEMILRRDDFVGWRINWQDKAHNIASLLSELNLGSDAAVFLDDSAFERARVRDALPDVLVPEVPSDPIQYPAFLNGLRCFDTPLISDEDRRRTSMYVADRGRTALQKDVQSLARWLELLELEVSVERLSDSNLERAAQLFNKTNQMNLATRRLAAAELLAWAQSTTHALWTFRVKDKFGDYGLCGIASVVSSDGETYVNDFLLSCRVVGRGVEDAMLATVAQHAKQSGAISLAGEYIPTPRNQPCLKWLQGLPNLAWDGPRFTLPLERPCVFPPHIRMSFQEIDAQVAH